MKPKFDPDIHEDSPPMTAEFLKGMRPSREVHGDEWVDRAMGRKRGRPKLEAPKED
jgi:hypothetical protein